MEVDDEEVRENIQARREDYRGWGGGYVSSGDQREEGRKNGKREDSRERETVNGG